MRNDDERLLDILDAAERIARIVAGGRAEYEASDIVQDALIRRIEVIGEAAGRLSDDFRSRHGGVPWRRATAMRNRTSHGYFDVDTELVWEVAVRDVPELASAVRRLMDEAASLDEATSSGDSPR